MKVKVIQVLVILWVWSNRFLTNASGVPERAKSEPLPVDLNLLKINTSYYNIFKSEGEPEGYKLVLKEEYVIKSITNNVDPIWKQRGDSFCKGFTMYNITDKITILIINIENKDNKDYIYILKDGGILGYLGLFNLLDELNRGVLQPQRVKKENLMISDPFDALYFKYSRIMVGRYSEEEFEPNDNEKFYSVSDKSQNIWTTKKVNEKEIPANKVHVYKEYVVESYRENRMLKRRTVSLYRMIIITLDNEEKVYYKLDKTQDKWVEMGKEEFASYYKSQGLRRKRIKNEEAPKVKSSRQGMEIVDITKKSDKFRYFKYNLFDYKQITMVVRTLKRVDKIHYENQMICETTNYNFIINLVKYKEDWHYIEYISKSESYINPIKYYTNYATDKEWKEVEKIDFLKMVHEEIKSCEEELCPKHANIFGIEKGMPTEKLPNVIREKIGDESINQPENIYEEIEEYQEKKDDNEQKLKKENEGIKEKQKDPNIKKKEEGEGEEENIYVNMDVKNKDGKDKDKARGTGTGTGTNTGTNIFQDKGTGNIYDDVYEEDDQGIFLKIDLKNEGQGDGQGNNLRDGGDDLKEDDRVKDKGREVTNDKDKSKNKNGYHRVARYWSFEDKEDKKDEMEKKKGKGKNKEELNESGSESDDEGEVEGESEDEREIDDKIVKKFIRKVKKISKKLKERIYGSSYKEEGVILWMAVVTVMWTRV